MKLPPPADDTPRKVRLALPADLAALIEDYAHYYEATYTKGIDQPELIAEIARAFLESDKDFKRWLKNKEG